MVNLNEKEGSKHTTTKRECFLSLLLDLKRLFGSSPGPLIRTLLTVNDPEEFTRRK